MKTKAFIIFIPLFLLVIKVNAQWTTEITFFENYFLEYVDIIDSNQVWVTGHYPGYQDSSVILRYTSFTNWIQYYSDLINNINITCIAGQDSDKIWIGTDIGKVYYSTNNGYNWTLQIDVGGQGYINDIKFSYINNNYGYIYSDPPAGPGTPFKLYKTINGGLNWIEYSPVFGGSYIGAEKSMCITDSNHVWIGLNCQPSFCYVPRVAFTTNGGINWLTSDIQNNSNYVSAVAFKYNNNYGLVSPWDAVPVYLYKTTNGGINWSFLYNTQLQQPVEAIRWANGTSIWYYCSSQDSAQIEKTTDDGITWLPMTSPHGSEQVISMDIIQQGNKIHGWAVTGQGRIMRLRDTTGVIGINNSSSQMPRRYVLFQNYPNPFNSSSVISFEIPKDGYVNLKVYNALGQIESILEEGIIRAGSYQKVFNPENLASGVYFYRLEAGDFTETKKMVLIK